MLKCLSEKYAFYETLSTMKIHLPTFTLGEVVRIISKNDDK